MDIVTKALSLIVLGGGGLASAYGIHHLISPKTLSDLLSSEEKILEEGSDTWNTLVSKYKQHQSGNHPIKNVSLDGTKDTETLRNACATLLQTRIQDLSEAEKTEKLKNIRDWCLTSSKGTDPTPPQA